MIGRTVLHRLIVALPVLVGISLIVFFLVMLQPGDPFVGMVDPSVPPEQKQILLQRAGFLDPIWLQYVRWAGRALSGDLGYSIQYGTPVATLIGERLGNTILLAGSALLFTLLIALPLGLYTGLRRYRQADVIISLFSFLFVSIPAFFLAMVLIKIFAASLRWLPTSGVITTGANYKGLDHVLDVLRHLILPASVLALTNIAILNRYLRSSISDLLGQNFVRALFARGIARKRIIRPHLLRNGAKPLITIVSIEIPTLLSATLLTETIFNWPGLGRLSFDAVQGRDYSLLMGIIMFLAIITLLSNLIADILYAVVDPRVRLGK